VTANIGVRELRQNLSVYLDRVKRGESLAVTEFRQVVAILRPPVQEDDDVIAKLVAEGRATAPSRTLADLPKPLSAILDELREDTI
jgi:antitoxin (DNA-binding transcriptional repressor) of toxin-antitoxin stability system